LDAIKALLQKYREILAYLIVGGLTTAVEWVVYLPITRVAHVPVFPSQVISVIAAVLFAYAANKIVVFRSHCPTRKAFFKEMASFFGSRAVTIFLQIGGFWLCEEIILPRYADNPLILEYGDIFIKGFISVAVIILNYIFSKLFVFRNKKEG